jgi:hypothetical protein
MQHAIQELYNNFPKVPMEVDTSLGEQVIKISESIQGFCAKIVDLESFTTPSTPPEERDK